jgi:carbon monoxide dehydrogenase subunit G
MELEHSFTIPVPPEQAWQVLLDVRQVAPCMPGATVDSVDGDVIKGRIKVKVGPVSLTYAGTARFTERDEQARSATLEASGKETRGSGTASATIRSTLADDEGGQTRVVVRTTMSVTGRPAQFGRGVMAEVGGKIIEKFAANLAAQLAGGSQPETGAAAGTGTAPEASPARGNGARPGAAAPSLGGALPLEELQLPVRAYNSLRRDGIHTVDDLSAHTEGELLAIDNLGPQSVKEIKRRLAGLGLHLADQPLGDGAPAAAASVPAPATGATGKAAGATAGGDATAGAGTRAGAATRAGAGDGELAQDMASPPAGAAGAAAGTGLGTDRLAAPGARPPDEDAIDLLSVAGFPVLKRALPVAGGLAALALVLLGIRRRRRRRAR